MNMTLTMSKESLSAVNALPLVGTDFEFIVDKKRYICRMINVHKLSDKFYRCEFKYITEKVT